MHGMPAYAFVQVHSSERTEPDLDMMLCQMMSEQESTTMHAACEIEGFLCI